MLDIATLIDHTYLRPECSLEDVKVLCKEAIQYGFNSVCIPPYYVFHTKKLLGNSHPKVSTVIGFPMGYSTTGAKVEEIKRSCNDGADELDVVANIAAIKNNDWSAVQNDIYSTTMITHLRGRKIKLTIEMGLLEEEEVIRICDIANKVGVDFVKTATGFANSDIKDKDVLFLKKLLNSEIKVEATGIIKTKAQAIAMLNAGADRIGTSSGIRILSMS
jgi:deoxyribose-phosphate aldolase